MPLGSRENDVMDRLWSSGPSTVAEVRLALGVGLAYTTVLTILRNLEAKGVVGRFGEGRAHRYFPRLSQHETREVAVKRLLERFFSGNPRLLLKYLSDTH